MLWGVVGFPQEKDLVISHREEYQEATKVLLTRVEGILYKAGKGGI